MFYRFFLGLVGCLLLASCSAIELPVRTTVIVVTATPQSAAPGAGTVAQPTATLSPVNPVTAAAPALTPAAAAATPTAAAAVPATGAAAPVSFDQIMDYKVVDANGVQIGEVKDAVIDRGAASNGPGQISYLVVESSTKNDWDIPAPWKYVQVRPDLQAVMLPVTANQLNAAPGFNKKMWPANVGGPNNVVQNFWANPGQAAGAAPVLPAGMAAGYLRASDVLSLDLTNPEGVKLGKIKDIAIDWKNSQPGAQAAQFRYLVMEMSKDMGFENRLVPIPWRLVQAAAGQENVVVNIAQNQLLTAPNFLQGSLPDLYSEPLNSQLSQFWPQ